MSWKNIKTFLILLFLCINVYLLIITYQSGNAKELTEGNIYDTWILLEKNGITIDKNIIPKNAPEYKNIELSPLDFDDKDSVKYDENGVITITADVIINEQNAAGVIKDTMQKSGLDTKNIVVKKKHDGYYVAETVGGMQIFNNILRVSIDSGKTVFKGIWYEYHMTDSYRTAETKAVYATSALIAFISEFAQNGSEITISDISFGYHAVTDRSTSNAKSISAAPCYCLTDINGKSYYYNILDTSFVE